MTLMRCSALQHSGLLLSVVTMWCLSGSVGEHDEGQILTGMDRPIYPSLGDALLFKP